MPEAHSRDEEDMQVLEVPHRCPALIKYSSKETTDVLMNVILHRHLQGQVIPHFLLGQLSERWR